VAQGGGGGVNLKGANSMAAQYH